MTITLKDGRIVELWVKGTEEEPEIVQADDELTDGELDYIYDRYAAELSEEAFQNQIMAAEYAFEGDR